MKVFVTGTRGIPSVLGGVERHCEQLYPLLVERGTDVKLSRRTPYVNAPLKEWHGVKLIDLYAPRHKNFEAIFHTAFSLLKAKKWGADIVHIHAIGPSILAPLGRLFGMKVVVTNHGPDYERQKWGRTAKFMLRFGEYLGCKYANEVIVISDPIQDLVTRRYGCPSNLIYNGVPFPVLTHDTDYLTNLGIEKGKYILAASRLVPEKGLHNLVEAFEGMDVDAKLVIAGESDYDDTYSKRLKARASANDNIIMPGYVRGKELEQLFTHARLFVLPSFHEGLSISLLEALSYGLPAVVSSIPANTEVNLKTESYFSTDDVQDLRKTLENTLAREISGAYRDEMRQWIKQQYNWSDIADQTLAVYKKALG